MGKKRDIVFNDPKSLESLFRKAGETKSSKEWKQLMENGPHPAQEILFEFAVGDLPASKRDELLEHTSHCLRCAGEVYSIRNKARSFKRFVEEGQTERQDGASFSLDTQIETKFHQPITLPSTGRVLAVKAFSLGSKDGRYWVPLLFKELRKGRARLSWSGDEAAKSMTLPEKSRGVRLDFHEQDFPGASKSMLRILPGDLLVYVDMPKKDLCTVVQITGHYLLSEVWDPERRGGSRHFLPCTYHGTFEKRSHYVFSQLFGALRGRRSYWDLTTIREHFAALLSIMEQKGSGPGLED